MSALTFDIDNYATAEEAFAAYRALMVRTIGAQRSKFGIEAFQEANDKFTKLQDDEFARRGGSAISIEAQAVWAESLFKKVH